MEICYNDNSCGGSNAKYPDTVQGANTLTSIGTFIRSMPLDPLNESPHQYTWTEGTYAYYCLYVKLEASDNTWLCSSNRGIFSKTSAAYTPINTDCCGTDVTQ